MSWMADTELWPTLVDNENKPPIANSSYSPVCTFILEYTFPSSCACSDHVTKSGQCPATGNSLSFIAKAVNL